MPIDGGFGTDPALDRTPSLEEAIQGAIERIANNVLSDPKDLAGVCARLKVLVAKLPEEQRLQTAEEMIAQTFARLANAEINLAIRSRLFKIGRRHVGLTTLIPAFGAYKLQFVTGIHKGVHHRRVVVITQRDWRDTQALLGGQFFPRESVTIIRSVLA